ncbi:hypothetical protein ACJX0J_031638, partial [Zea mays]
INIIYYFYLKSCTIIINNNILIFNNITEYNSPKKPSGRQSSSDVRWLIFLGLMRYIFDQLDTYVALRLVFIAFLLGTVKQLQNGFLIYYFYYKRVHLINKQLLISNCIFSFSNIIDTL